MAELEALVRELTHPEDPDAMKLVSATFDGFCVTSHDGRMVAEARTLLGAFRKLAEAYHARDRRS